MRRALEEEARRRGLPIPQTTKSKPLWSPLPGPQTLAYYSDADRLFYGGQAGGGKTDLEIGLAITQHRKSILFRREYGQLEDIILRSREIIGQAGSFNQSTNVWKALPGERTLKLAAVQHEIDKQKFKGRPHDGKFFDELPDFTQSQFEFLIAWTRTVIPGQRTRVVGAGNPPSTAEGEWVLEYWAPWLDRQHPRPASPGELRWYCMIDGKYEEVEGGTPILHRGSHGSSHGELLKPHSRTFVPASVQDNPFLLQTGYVDILQNLPEPLRSQLLYGDFQADREDHPWQVIPTRWVELAMSRWETTPKPTLANGAPLPLSCLGVDPARGGKDQFAIARRYGNWFAPLETQPGTKIKDGPQGAAKVMLALEGPTPVNIDVIGIGSSVYDSLIGYNVAAVPINNANASEKTDRSGRLKMRNKRAEGLWGLREALDPQHGDALCLPPDPELKSDLCAPKFRVTASGLLIESKDEVKDRIGRSPDKGDAVVLAHMGGGLPAGEMADTMDEDDEVERDVNPWDGGHRWGV